MQSSSSSNISDMTDGCCLMFLGCPALTITGVVRVMRSFTVRVAIRRRHLSPVRGETQLTVASSLSQHSSGGVGEIGLTRAPTAAQDGKIHSVERRSRPAHRRAFPDGGAAGRADDAGGSGSGSGSVSGPIRGSVARRPAIVGRHAVPGNGASPRRTDISHQRRLSHLRRT